MPWADLLGHEAAVASLRRALASGRLHHALLLHGPPGTGKHTAARLLAQALCCTSLPRMLAPSDDETPSLFGFESGDGASTTGRLSGGASPAGIEPGDPCGTCPACRRIEAGMHPDVREVGFEPSESTGKMRQEIVIPQIRELSDYLSLRPLEAGRRVAIVDPADRMNAAAANAFLKTLEEPPAGAIIVLIARNRHALLPTIRSRCRPVAFGRVPVPLIEAALHRRGVDERDAALAACLGDGAPGRSIALAASVKEAAGDAGGASEPAAAAPARRGAKGSRAVAGRTAPAAPAGESPLETFRKRRDRVLAALELAAGVRPGASRAPAPARGEREFASGRGGVGRGSRALQAADSFFAKDPDEFAVCLDLAEMLLRDALVISAGAMDPRSPGGVAAAASADDAVRLLPLAEALGARRAAAVIERTSAIRADLRSNVSKQLAIECLLVELGA